MATTVKASKAIISEEKIDRVAEENPDLAHEFIKNILIAQKEAHAGKLEVYRFSNQTFIEI